MNLNVMQEELLKRNELVLREMEGLQAEKRREILEQEKERLSEIDVLFEEEVERWRKQCAERLDTIDSDLLRETEAHARQFGLPGSDSSAGSYGTDVSAAPLHSPHPHTAHMSTALAPLSEPTSSSRDDTLASGSTAHYAVGNIGGQQRLSSSPLRPSDTLPSPSPSNTLARQSQPASSPLKRATLDSGNLSFRQSTQMYFPSARSDAANRNATLPSSVSADNISQSGARPTSTNTK